MSIRLEDIELIKQLKHKYCRCLDTRNSEELATCVTADVYMLFVGGSYRFELNGRDNVVQTFAALFHEDFVGSHIVHLPEITVVDDALAHGRWTMTDFAYDFRIATETTGVCLYKDTYVKEDGAWRIQRSAYRRLWERVEKPAVAPNFTARYLAERAANAEI